MDLSNSLTVDITLVIILLNARKAAKYNVADVTFCRKVSFLGFSLSCGISRSLVAFLDSFIDFLHFFCLVIFSSLSNIFDVSFKVSAVSSLI